MINNRSFSIAIVIFLTQKFFTCAIKKTFICTKLHSLNYSRQFTEVTANQRII